MGRIEELKQELAKLEADEKEADEIKRLEKQIHAKKFSQSKSGKVFNKIADVGEGIGKAVMGAGKNNSLDAPKKKKKVPTVEDMLRDLPQ